jgi:hypothetical protein
MITGDAMMIPTTIAALREIENESPGLVMTSLCPANSGAIGACRMRMSSSLTTMRKPRTSPTTRAPSDQMMRQRNSSR